MRLIDADDRIEFIKNAYCPECDNYNGVRCRTCPISDMLDALDDAPTVDQWHYPSKGEYPDKGKVLICLNELDEGEPRMEIATLEWTGKFFLGHNCNDYLADEIRAWMPLPDPPKEEA